MAQESISEPITPEIVILPDEVRSRSSEGKPIASKSGATSLYNPRRASTGSFGNRGRKFSSGKSSPLSGGSESPVPHYLRASTGSCHDFCKYGKKQETEVKPWQNRAKKMMSPISNQQSRLEAGESSEKKITNAVKSKPPVSKTISRNKSIVSENKVSSSANELKDTAVNKKKNIVLVKRNTLDLSGKKDIEIKPVKIKGISKEPTRGKLVSSPVAYLATKPSFNRDLGLKFIANTSKKLFTPPKDQNKVAKSEIKRQTNDIAKEETLHVTTVEAEAKKKVPESKEKKHKEVENELVVSEIKRQTNDTVKEETLHVTTVEAEAKKTVPESKEKKHKEVENELVVSEKVTDETLPVLMVNSEKSTFDPSPSEVSLSPTFSSPIKSPELSYGEEEASADALEYNSIEKEENLIDILSPSESSSSLNISSPDKSQALSFGEDEAAKDEAQDELRFAHNKKKVSESERNESNIDLLSSESVSSPNISSPVRTPALSYADEEAQDELEYLDSETDGSDESISECNETLHSEDEETSVGHHNIETRKAKGVSEGNDKATKLKFKRGKEVETESNHSGPRRLRFRRARVLGENEDNDVNNRRRTFKNGRDIDDINSINDDSEKVVLRHQQVEGKKDAQGLFNNVIEETASKLAETRKSKVKALVGAFETVISLQESNPSTPTAP